MQLARVLREPRAKLARLAVDFAASANSHLESFDSLCNLVKCCAHHHAAVAPNRSSFAHDLESVELGELFERMFTSQADAPQKQRKVIQMAIRYIPCANESWKVARKRWEDLAAKAGIPTKLGAAMDTSASWVPIWWHRGYMFSFAEL